MSSLVGCAPGSLAAEGAGQGAKSGAIGGAVAGAVGSLFWGGDVVENMVVGAAVTAVRRLESSPSASTRLRSARPGQPTAEPRMPIASAMR